MLKCKGAQLNFHSVLALLIIERFVYLTTHGSTAQHLNQYLGHPWLVIYFFRPRVRLSQALKPNTCSVVSLWMRVDSSPRIRCGCALVLLSGLASWYITKADQHQMGRLLCRCSIGPISHLLFISQSMTYCTPTFFPPIIPVSKNTIYALQVNAATFLLVSPCNVPSQRKINRPLVARFSFSSMLCAALRLLGSWFCFLEYSFW